MRMEKPRLLSSWVKVPWGRKRHSDPLPQAHRESLSAPRSKDHTFHVTIPGQMSQAHPSFLESKLNPTYCEWSQWTSIEEGLISVWVTQTLNLS